LYIFAITIALTTTNTTPTTTIIVKIILGQEDTHVKGKTDEGVDEPVTQADARSNRWVERRGRYYYYYYYSNSPRL